MRKFGHQINLCLGSQSDINIFYTILRLKLKDSPLLQHVSSYSTFSSCLWEGLNLNKYWWSRTHFVDELPQSYFTNVMVVIVQHSVCESFYNSLTPYNEFLQYCILNFDSKMNSHSIHHKMSFINVTSRVLTGEDVQRLLNMFLGSLTPKNEILVSIVRAPKGRVVVWS